MGPMPVRVMPLRTHVFSYIGSFSAMVGRLAMSDFMFSDGTVIPKGSMLIVAGRAINQDEVGVSHPFRKHIPGPHYNFQALLSKSSRIPRVPFCRERSIKVADVGVES